MAVNFGISMIPLAFQWPWQWYFNGTAIAIIFGFIMTVSYSI
jgi:hypothetical protein